MVSPSREQFWGILQFWFKSWMSHGYHGILSGVDKWVVESFHHRGDGTRTQGELFPPPTRKASPTKSAPCGKGRVWHETMQMVPPHPVAKTRARLALLIVSRSFKMPFQQINLKVLKKTVIHRKTCTCCQRWLFIVHSKTPADWYVFRLLDVSESAKLPALASPPTRLLGRDQATCYPATFLQIVSI